MQGKQRQDEDLVKFGLPGGRSDDVRAFLAGMRETFAPTGSGLADPGLCRYSWWQRRIG